MTTPAPKKPAAADDAPALAPPPGGAVTGTLDAQGAVMVKLPPLEEGKRGRLFVAVMHPSKPEAAVGSLALWFSPTREQPAPAEREVTIGADYAGYQVQVTCAPWGGTQ